MGNIQDIIRIFSANILLAAKEDLSVKILARRIIITGIMWISTIKEMNNNNAVVSCSHHNNKLLS